MKRIGTISIIGLVLLVTATVLLLYSKQTNNSLQSSSMKSLEIVPEEDSQVIMGHMNNQTERAELGRATWKFLHTMMARYPEIPTQKERDSLHDFMFLFSKMYPCGECAQHFNQLITQYPPQTSSRSAASQWLCAMHNNVNQRLKKPVFDCNNIESKYPCGCAEEK